METAADNSDALVRQKLEGDEAGRDAYYAKRNEQVVAGEPTWIVRDFEAYSGRIYDFYTGGLAVAFVEAAPELGSFDVYISVIRAGQPESVLMGSYDYLGDAVASVETNCP